MIGCAAYHDGLLLIANVGVATRDKSLRGLMKIVRPHLAVVSYIEYDCAGLRQRRLICIVDGRWDVVPQMGMPAGYDDVTLKLRSVLLGVNNLVP